MCFKPHLARLSHKITELDRTGECPFSKTVACIAKSDLVYLVHSSNSVHKTLVTLTTEAKILRYPETHQHE